MTTELRQCPRCGKNMIQVDTGKIFSAYPAQYEWKWWCGCGKVEEGGVRKKDFSHKVLQRKWEEVNK